MKVFGMYGFPKLYCKKGYIFVFDSFFVIFFNCTATVALILIIAKDTVVQFLNYYSNYRV